MGDPNAAWQPISTAPKDVRSRRIFCCGCQTEVAARLVTGGNIYPHRPDLADKWFWRCDCGLYVGCHPGSKSSLGNIPTAALRTARGHIHALIDPAWKSGRIRRSALYAKLSERLGKQYHTAEIRSVDEARQVYLAAREVLKKCGL